MNESDAYNPTSPTRPSTEANTNDVDRTPVYERHQRQGLLLNTTAPFQIAHTVSIHKAQRLEYHSVKIVMTAANEDDITRSIFYTAINPRT